MRCAGGTGRFQEVGRAAVGELYPPHDVGVVQDRQDIKECDGVGGKRHWE